MLETQPYVGQRVILNHLLHNGDFLGEIVGVGVRLCVVKLECQDVPVSSVLYYDKKPAEVISTLWQICYPRKGET